MCVILSATVTLCCLFMPKMYIVLLHPEKYARSTPGEKTGGGATGVRTSISGPAGGGGGGAAGGGGAGGAGAGGAAVSIHFD